MRTVKTDQTGHRSFCWFCPATAHLSQTIGGVSNADMQSSYQVREDIYKYFVNASSIRFSFKCFHATCSVLRNIKKSDG